MKMTFRWYGEGNDTVSLSQIKQIPGVEGLVWSLHDEAAGADWPMEKILAVKKAADTYGFNLDVVESVNVHEDIKLGLPSRDMYIENYIKTLGKLQTVGVKVVCYNFMPVFDWTRTDLFHPLPDGSTALFYESAKVTNVDPQAFLDDVVKQDKAGLTMPGWEPERLAHIKELFDAYKNVTEEDLWNNLQYFLEKVVPAAEQYGIQMAIHPDDPAWPIFGLPRLIINKANVGRFLKLVDRPANGLTLCTGSLGTAAANDIPDIIRTYGDRIHFTHIRNLKRFENGDFTESSHKTSDGSVDIAEVVRVYHDIGYKGYCRPDHGRHIWGEECRPGYGLYDRALGIMYLWGLWDAYENCK